MSPSARQPLNDGSWTSDEARQFTRIDAIQIKRLATCPAASMFEALALIVVVLAGLYFCVLAAAALVRPALASRFLLGFAGSPRAHYTELAIRLLVGWSLVIHAPHMPYAGAFSLFGWILLVTTACLLAMPWRWHHRFAQQTVPRAVRHIGLIGLASLALGGSLLAAVFRGTAA